MWASVISMVVLVMLAVAQGLPKEINQYRAKNVEPIHSPRGRFGRSCFLRAGGCLGKRAKAWDILQISPEEFSDLSTDLQKEYNAINELSPSPSRLLDTNPLDKVENQKIGRLQRFPNFNLLDDKLQRTLDQDYATFYLQ